MRTAGSRADALADAQSELVWLVYEVLRNQRAWEEVLGRLQQLMAAEAVVLGRHDFATKSGAYVHQIGMDPVLAGRY
jgi:hypothetical protein